MSAWQTLQLSELKSPLLLEVSSLKQVNNHMLTLLNNATTVLCI